MLLRLKFGNVIEEIPAICLPRKFNSPPPKINLLWVRVPLRICAVQFPAFFLPCIPVICGTREARNSRFDWYFGKDGISGQTLMPFLFRHSKEAWISSVKWADVPRRRSFKMRTRRGTIRRGRPCMRFSSNSHGRRLFYMLYYEPRVYKHGNNKPNELVL